MTPTQKKPAHKAKRSHNRSALLLTAAAKLFATKGYKETTMRDIGAEIGMQPGSVYYHFKSKQALLLAVYAEGVNGIQARIRHAVATEDDPWRRLETAVVTHIETILDQNDFARVMIGVLPAKLPEIQAELITMRDEYELIFIKLIDALPLKTDVDKKMLRLLLLGAINATQTWYHAGENSPGEIGRAFVTYLRFGVTAVAIDQTDV